MTLAELPIQEQRDILLAELKNAGEELQRYRCGDNRALRTVREISGDTAAQQ